MKTGYLTIIALLSFVKGYSQQIAKADSSVLALKTYLQRRTLPSAEMREQNIQGLVIMGFKIDSNKKMTDLHFLKSSTEQYNSNVTNVLTSYTKEVLLPPAEYSIAFEFLLLFGKTKKVTIPFDKSLYPNFLFEVDIIYNN
jgi:hypothetical protein